MAAIVGLTGLTYDLYHQIIIYELALLLLKLDLCLKFGSRFARSQLSQVIAKGEDGNLKFFLDEPAVAAFAGARRSKQDNVFKLHN